jgi:hypothetical protein
MDGTSYSSDTVYLPCNLTAIANDKHSACCAYGDLCLTNGLCRNPDNDAKGLNHYWQVGCTDATFNDDACPKYCQEVSMSGMYGALSYPATIRPSEEPDITRYLP